MTNYEILADRCVQTGNCWEIAPSLFEVDDDGVVTSKESAEGEDEQSVLKDAARACPAQAIKLQE
ncbi:ferredoxin [Williamsia sp. D3]|uniref:ferredoxin n=1 Tax=Williamsia sp. D3 TaxID=1313067 RepID=UPI0003D2D02D|nr:ferredoxin [Williamsia sp. D3]ETD33320.1 ferredoxin [Williamsia sp. D3]